VKCSVTWAVKRQPCHRTLPKPPIDQLASIACLNRSRSPSQHSHLNTDFSLEELKTDCSNLRAASAPGPNGLTVAFYCHFWDTIGPFLPSLIIAVRYGDSLLEDSLEAAIILLPRTISVRPIATDFRPISLLNGTARFGRLQLLPESTQRSHAFEGPRRSVSLLRGTCVRAGARVHCKSEARRY
jgi:hypothetical protein